MKTSKGFTYIIIVVIIISFITSLFLLFKPEPFREYTSNKLSDNYKNELKYLVESNITTTTIDNLNSDASEFIKAHNFEVSICTIISDDNSIYLSNYTGATQKGILTSTTIEVTSELNPNNISIGGCSVDVNSATKISYYIAIAGADINHISYVRGSDPNNSDINGV